mgnify:CR=1 FL=1
MINFDRPAPASPEAEDALAAEATARIRNGLRIALLMLAAIAVYIPIALYLAFRSGAWQLSVQAAVVSAVGVVGLFSLALIRRGSLRLGVQLMVAGALAAALVSVVLIDGISVAIALIVVLLVASIAGRTLPTHEAGWLAVAAVAVAIVGLSLDLYNPVQSLPAPALLLAFVWVLAVTAALLFASFTIAQFIDYPLRIKLILSLLILTLIPLIIMAYLSQRAMREALINEANQTLYGTAAQTAASVDAFIRANLNDIRTEARMPALISYLNLPAPQRPGSIEEAQAAATLQALSGKDVVNIASYALLNVRGRNLMDTNVAEIGRDESANDYFQVPLQTGLPYVSAVSVAPRTDAASLYFSAPVRDVGGNVAAVLRVRYNAAILQRLIAQSTGLAGPGTFGILCDENQVYLAHGTTPALTLRPVTSLSPAQAAELQAVGRLIANEPLVDRPDLAQGLRRAQTQPYFTIELAPEEGGLHSAAVAGLETQPWLVVFLQPQDVFLAPAELQTRAMAGLAAVIAAVTTAAAVGLTQLLAGPITRLTAVAEKVAAGDLSVRARTEAADEIGALASTFNRMAAQLGRTLEGLEQRVASRTRDLQRRSVQLEAAAQVAREAAAIRDVTQLLGRTVHLISERFGFYHAGIFLLDEVGEYAVLRAASSEGGQRMIARGHKLRVGEVGIVGYVAESGQPRIALDVGEDAVYFDNPDMPRTHSEICLLYTSPSPRDS